MRYSLRTLLMLTIMGPPVLAVCYYVWHPPSNFDIVELRLLAVAVIFAGLAAAGGIAVVWRSGKPT